MLKRFCVENFKNFQEKIIFDLSQPCNYEFNTEVVADGCLTKGIIYGPNGSGKSNLGLALFDIIFHLTDKQKKIKKYDNYTNMNSSKSYAEFEYTFWFCEKELVYRYRKTDVQTLLDEHLYINGEEVIYYDFTKNEGFTKLKGTETLNIIASNSPLSRVKFVRNNAILAEDKKNEIFQQFMDFVEHMLLFYSLDERGYQGFSVGSGSIAEGIINSGHVEDFEKFLNSQGVKYSLYVKEIDEQKMLYCKFDRQDVNFFSIASTGTSSLALFYYWYIKMKEVSFVFIDEFDAFYHFELAESIVKLLCSLEKTQIFLTTHNTDLMSNDLLRPDCYFIIDNKRISPISMLTDKELRKAHNLQKMYKAGAFNE